MANRFSTLHRAIGSRAGAARNAGLLAAMVLSASPIVYAQAPELTGERVPTNKGDLVIHPIRHATFVMSWNGKIIYVDPVGGTEAFAKLPKPDVILITDIHGDHLNAETVQAVRSERTTIIAPAAVAERLPPAVRAKATVLANGRKTSVDGIDVEAIPMYNLTPERLRFHSKGRGNGYVLTLGGKRVYISGDTEDIPEMRQLKNIDVAFVCMNLPYTMTPQQAAAAVREFKPGICYPYHHRGSDVEDFKRRVTQTKGIDVRLLNWYP